MPDETGIPAADNILALVGGAKPDLPPEAVSTGVPAADKLLALVGRPEWSDERYSLPSRLNDFVQSNARAGRGWEEAAPEIKDRFGVNPDPIKQGYRLEEERGKQASDGESTLEYFARRSLPLGSAVGNFARTNRYGSALERYKKGEATDRDLEVIARYERLQQIDQQTESTTAGAIGSGLAGVPAVLGEGFAGGTVFRGLGLFGRAAAAAPEVAAETGVLRSATGFLGKKAAQTAALPSMYLAQGAENQLRNPDESTASAYGRAFGYGMMQTAILGQLANRAPGKSLFNKVATGVPLGMVEQQAADVLGSATGISTGYGLLGDILNKPANEALKHAAVQAVTFAAFSALHGKDPGPILDEIKSKLDASHEKGDSPEEAAQKLLDEIVARTPDLQPKEKPQGKGQLSKAMLDDIAMRQEQQAKIDRLQAIRQIEAKNPEGPKVELPPDLKDIAADVPFAKPVDTSKPVEPPTPEGARVSTEPAPVANGGESPTTPAPGPELGGVHPEAARGVAQTVATVENRTPETGTGAKTQTLRPEEVNDLRAAIADLTPEDRDLLLKSDHYKQMLARGFTPGEPTVPRPSNETNFSEDIPDLGRLIEESPLSDREKSVLQAYGEKGGLRPAAKALGVSHEKLRQEATAAFEKWKNALADKYGFDPSMIQSARSIKDVIARLGEGNKPDAVQPGVLFSGIPIPTLFPKPRDRADAIPAPVKADSPDVESRLSAAHGVQKTPLLDRIKEIADAAWRGLTRAQVHLPKTEEFHVAREAFRLLKTIPNTASDEVNRTIAGIVDPLGPKQLALFERKLLVDNQLASVDRGEPLRFGFKDRAEVAAYKAKLDALVAATPDVQKALAMREANRRMLTQEAVDLKILNQEAVENDAYYHQMVSDMMNDARYTGGARPLKLQRSFQKARVTGVESLPEQFDYNTSYLEAESRWMTEMKMEVAKEKWLRQFMTRYDVLPGLKQEAKDRDTTWQKIMKDYPQFEVWSPQPGNLFYRAFTIPEKLAEELIHETYGEFDFDPLDLKKALVMGGMRRPMVMPKELVAQLEETLKPKPMGKVAQLSRDLMGSWKTWGALFGPKRILGYMTRNLTGDIEPILASAPGAIGKVPRATGELHNYYSGELKMSPDLERARDLGVIDSSMTATEIPDVKDLPVFRRLYDQPGKLGALVALPAKYMEVAKRYNAFRESIGRYSAYLYYKDKLDKGEPVNYGGASKSTVDKLQSELGNDVAAAHLARNLLGDYGNLTQFGDWMRQHAAPFWSWTEINFKRWPKLTENAIREGLSKDTLRAGSVFTAAALMRLGSLYAAVWTWNNTVMGEDERKLSPKDRASLHLTLGHNSDGSVRVFRRVGSANDFLEWFGVDEILAAPPQASTKEVAADVAKGVANKLFQSVRPDIKTGVEVTSGQSLFPDAFRPRPGSRDELAASPLGLTDELKFLKGKLGGTGDVVKGGSEAYQRRLLGTADIIPGQAALSEIHDLRRRFLESQGKPAEPAYGRSSIAKMQDAMNAGDFGAFQDARRIYLEGGGNQKKFRESLSQLDPIKAKLNASLERKFQNEYLNDEQRGKLEVARQYAESQKRKLQDWWARAR